MGIAARATAVVIDYGAASVEFGMEYKDFTDHKELKQNLFLNKFNEIMDDGNISKAEIESFSKINDLEPDQSAFWLALSGVTLPLLKFDLDDIAKFAKATKTTKAIDAANSARKAEETAIEQGTKQVEEFAGANKVEQVENATTNQRARNNARTSSFDNTGINAFIKYTSSERPELSYLFQKLLGGGRIEEFSDEISILNRQIQNGDLLKAYKANEELVDVLTYPEYILFRMLYVAKSQKYKHLGDTLFNMSQELKKAKKAENFKEVAEIGANIKILINKFNDHLHMSAAVEVVQKIRNVNSAEAQIRRKIDDLIAQLNKLPLNNSVKRTELMNEIARLRDNDLQEALINAQSPQSLTNRLNDLMLDVPSEWREAVLNGNMPRFVYHNPSSNDAITEFDRIMSLFNNGPIDELPQNYLRGDYQVPGQSGLGSLQEVPLNLNANDNLGASVQRSLDQNGTELLPGDANPLAPGTLVDEAIAAGNIAEEIVSFTNEAAEISYKKFVQEFTAQNGRAPNPEEITEKMNDIYRPVGQWYGDALTTSQKEFDELVDSLGDVSKNCIDGLKGLTGEQKADILSFLKVRGSHYNEWTSGCPVGLGVFATHCSK